MLRALLSAGVACGLTGCIIDLERRIACGDGYVDVGQGEECDPGDPDSYEDQCPPERGANAVAACDEETCEIIDTPEQCASCGDGILDMFLGEECDGDDINGAVCPSGSGTPRCLEDCTLDFGPTACDQCGNGDVQMEEGEECEPVADGGIVGGSTTCVGLINLVGGGKLYTSGEAISCEQDTCKWDRSGCGFCGNGRLETDEPVAPGLNARPEFCDEEKFDLAALQLQEPNPICDADDTLRVSHACGEDCRSFVPRAGEDPCCVLKGGPCPLFGSNRKCCIELEQPDIDPDDVCDRVIVENQDRDLCN